MSQRKDRCLIPPKTLKAAAAQKVATKLLKGGLVREIKAKTGMEAWAAARSAPTATAPRQGTKTARVIELLKRDQGARLDELIAATGWLPHTARAALTGLRHRGYDVRLERGETGSVYRAIATLAASA